MSYRPLYEDPTYDDDGQCVDEDFDLNDQPEDIDSEIYGPYSTVNS